MLSSVSFGGRCPAPLHHHLHSGYRTVKTVLFCCFIGYSTVGYTLVPGTQPHRNDKIHKFLRFMDRLGSGGVVGRLGFRVGVSASYSYFHLSLNKRAECVLSC